MTDEGGHFQLVASSSAVFTVPTLRRIHPFHCAIIFLVVLIVGACGLQSQRHGIPPEIEGVIGTVTEDVTAERYDKIYNESSDLWKQQLTQEESAAVFKTLREKLGKMQNRALHSAVAQNNSGGALQGNAFIVTYQTKFEKGEAMETFTLLEREHQWQLARYFVNSTALK
ncbi:MAG: DUF4019 domain-containing protein [Acidobacteriota bacterium]